MALDPNDPNASDSSPGFLGGLLGLFKPPDVQKMYGGLLSDPATQSAFRQRGLDAMAAAFGEGAMPVPYKGGIPIGATLGKAAYAADQGMDSLQDARLKSAQQMLALANAGNAQAQTVLMRAAVEGYQNRPLNRQGQPGAGAGTGTGGASVAGGPVTGAAKILTDQGQVTPAMVYNHAIASGASENKAMLLASASNAESGGNPNATHDAAILASRGFGPGYGLFGHNTDRLSDMYKYANVQPGQPVPWQTQVDFALDELNRNVLGAGDLAERATNPDELTAAQLAYERPKGWNTGGGNREQRLASTSQLWNNRPKPDAGPPPTQTASAAPGAGPVGGYGPGASGVYVPPGGGPTLDIQTGQPVGPDGKTPVPAPDAGPPMAPPQAKPPGLLTPQGAAAAGASTAVPLAEPPAAPPGPQGLLAPPPEGAPPLNPNAQAILQGTQNPLPPGGPVAGPGAPSGPPSSPGPDIAANTGAAGAAALQGLLNQPPAGPPPQPAGGPPGPQGPPAAAPVPPPPVAPPAPPSPSAAPPAMPPPPPMPQPPPPPQLPPNLNQHISDEEIQWAKRQAALLSAAKLPVPADVAAEATLDTDMAKEAQKQALDNAYKNQQAEYQSRLRAWEAQVKPYDMRENSLHVDPQTQTMTGNYRALAADGRMHTYYLPPGGQPRDLGASDRSPYEQAAGTAAGTAAGGLSGLPGYQPPPVPGAPTAPGAGPPPTTPGPAPATASPAATPPGLTGPIIIGGQQLTPAPVTPKTPEGTYVTPHGSNLPGVNQQFMPQSVEELKKLVQDAPALTRAWSDAVDPARTAEQRLETMYRAYQMMESGAYTTDKLRFQQLLTALNIDPKIISANKISDIQIAMHENILSSLPALREQMPRPTQFEFKTISANRANPDLAPAANMQMLAEDIAQARQVQYLSRDWNTAQLMNWRNPDSFKTVWSDMNKPADEVARVKQEMGPLKGMEPANLPAGAVRTDRTYQGKPVYTVPDGKGGTRSWTP